MSLPTKVQKTLQKKWQRERESQRTLKTALEHCLLDTPGPSHS